MAAGCDEFRYPRDPNDTLERVLASGRMRVAAVDHVPWVMTGDGPGPRGAEVELVEAFAREIGVRVEWQRAPAFEALEALKGSDLDLAVGGFNKTAVAGHKSASHTYPYFTEALVVAFEPGEPPPQDLAGQKVHVAPDLIADHLVRRRGGIPVAEKIASVRLALLPGWKLAQRGLVPTEFVLRKDEHVMAVPPGENAWIMRLERFLRARSGNMADRLRTHSP